MITREEIDTIQFSTTRVREGYVQDEVDDFLDRVGPAFDELDAAKRKFETDNQTLRSEIARLRDMGTSDLTLYKPPPATGERILALAEETAQRHIGEAVTEADRIRADANAEAGQVRASARAEASGIVAAAESDRQRILNELESARVELVEQIEHLKAKRSNYKSWLKAALNNIEQEEAQYA